MASSAHTSPRRQAAGTGGTCAAVLGLACSLGALACTTPDPNPPGLEEQPTWEFWRSPATMPSVTDPDAPVNEPWSGVDDRDSKGTVRTPASVLPEPAVSPPSRRATATLEPAKGAQLQGEVTLSEAEDGVHVKVEVENENKGSATVAVRAGGDCREAGAKALSRPNKTRTEEADYLGNIRVDDQGKGTLEVLLPSATLRKDDPESLVGRALVIQTLDELHAKQAASKGKTLACALIEADGKH